MDEAKIQWIGDAAFIGNTPSGHTIVMDGPPEGGGKNWGARPMEMLILGMGACSTYDVVSILKKSRQKIINCEAKISYQRSDNHPKVFTCIHIHFIVSGHNLQEKKVARAIELSAEQYCSASIMLAAVAKITHDFELINVL